MTDSQTKRKRGPESPEARLARADRIAGGMKPDEREDLLAMLADEADPVTACEETLAAQEEYRDAAIAKAKAAIETARANFTAESERIAKRKSVATIYAALDAESKARLVRLVRSLDGGA